MTNPENFDQASTLRNRMENKKTLPLVIAVASGKGGVGKSSVAVNLACQLGLMGRKILLFDADFGLGNTDILLGIRTTVTLSDAIKDGTPLSQIAIPLDNGVTLIPAGSGSFNLANANPAALEGVFLELERLAIGFDLVILDTGAGIGERVRDALLFADRIVVVTTPDPASLTDSYATIKVVSKKDSRKKFAVIVNKASSQSQGDKVFAQLSHVARKYLNVTVDSWGMVPDDERMQMAIRRQQAVTICYPSTAASAAFRKIASLVTGEPAPTEGRSFSNFVKSFFGGDDQGRNVVVA